MEYIGFVTFTYYYYSSSGSIGARYSKNCWTQLHHTSHTWCPIKYACLIQKKSVTLRLTLTQGYQSAYILKNLITLVPCKIFAFRLQILKPSFGAKLLGHTSLLYGRNVLDRFYEMFCERDQKFAISVTTTDINPISVPSPPFWGTRNSEVFSDFPYLLWLPR